ncbi:MAG: 2-hydroxyacyl-CoA dehydratase [candidate division WOR-3 bacterium]|nr:2-hydroxyacyl-CoA dehydratase [candidate division WOR-3 bacterium]MCX7757359.1 2-hydroxyacyl-CoA dehydratase [candidate division WOR-3 bacterium]MDW7987485.1 2-hydroxyacyl-CoA dehydratase [candidate division WOR-3 bacterium]
MKVAFPYLGYDTIALKKFVELLGAESCLGPPLTARTLSLGTKYSPELICLPFKITLGNFIEALEAGADTLLMAAGARKCRFGYYHYLQENILKKIDNRHCFYAISQYTPYEFFFKKMPQIFGVTPQKVIYATWLLLHYSALIDYFRKLIRLTRAYNFYDAQKKELEALRIIENVSSFKEVQKAKKELRKIFSPIINTSNEIIRIGLVGEIYLMLEPFANYEIEKELGKLGVLVVSKRSLYRHLKHLLKLDLFDLRTISNAYKYLKDSPGGEAIKTVGEAHIFAKKNIDGIIHIYPFTCMPENIAYEALQKLARDYEIPILSISIDEHTSKTGLLTRLEAFVEVVKRKKFKG